MKRKIVYLWGVCFSVFCLVGWGEKEIELLDNKKLIDLDKAIEYTKPGGGFEKNEVSSDDYVTSQENNEEGISEKTENQEDLEIGDSNVKYINVHEEQILYCGNPIIEADLVKVLKDDNGDEIRFVLVDDWAEAQVYKRVLAALMDAHNSYGLIFSEEQ